MGLFDIFKKKAEPEVEPVIAASVTRNNVNSVFTLRFTLPYFQIFDKTDPKLKSLPVMMSVHGSCQYRISEPDLCFDNVPLCEMSPAQLEAHVKDALAMNIKSFFNSITTIPLLQFESMIAKISDATKARITPVLSEEFGVSLRTFNIAGVRYDTEDENYLRLQAFSIAAAENQIKAEKAFGDLEIESMKVKTQVENQRLRNKLEKERLEDEFELENRRNHAEVDIEKRRAAIEAGTDVMDEMTFDTKKDDFDLGGLDDSFKL